MKFVVAALVAASAAAWGLNGPSGYSAPAAMAVLLTVLLMVEDPTEVDVMAMPLLLPHTQHLNARSTALLLEDMVMALLLTVAHMATRLDPLLMATIDMELTVM